MNYILTLFLIFLTLVTGISNEYNCTGCYNAIINNNLTEYCTKVIQNDCTVHNLENNNAGIILCGYIVENHC